jgi:DNA polymerase (family 10)
MDNAEVARILHQMADVLEIQEVKFKPTAYRNAARTVEGLTKDINTVNDEGRLKDLPGVGEAIARKIAELLDTGKLGYYEKLKKKTPFDFEALLDVPGLGPKKVALLYRKLGVKTIDDLKRAAKQGKIRELPGMGEKSEKEILENVGFTVKRVPFKEAQPIAQHIVRHLKKVPGVRRVDVAGSLRRKKETIGDLDILATAIDASALVDVFTSLKDVKVLARGKTKCSIRLKSGLQVDLRIVPEESYGAALQYFTGSKEHNVALRRIAIDKGYKLNEYGLFKATNRVAGRSETEVYTKLGLAYIDPEKRVNRGEIEEAQRLFPG